jgi:hypothetical protein
MTRSHLDFALISLIIAGGCAMAILFTALLAVGR